VNAFRRDAHCGERRFHVRHEAWGPAEIHICFFGHADFGENRRREATGGIEIPARRVVRVWPAVTNVAAPVWKAKHQAPNFGRERMMLAIASSVQPEDMPDRVSVGQGVQHGEDGRRADSGAEQYKRPLAGLKNKAAARRADVESIAGPNVLLKPGSGCAVRFDFNADSIALR
jgi:hypothetical protein